MMKYHRCSIYYCGLDFGFAIDPLAFVRCSYDRQTVYLIDEIYKRQMSNADLAAAIKDKGYLTKTSLRSIDLFGIRDPLSAAVRR